MFKYLCKRQRFVIALGNYISHKIVRQGTVSVETLNSLDRYQLANEFYNTACSDLFEGGIGREDMIDDIAEYMDLRIPQAYAKWVLHEYDKGPSKMVVNAKDFGLMYQFNHND